MLTVIVGAGAGGVALLLCLLLSCVVACWCYKSRKGQCIHGAVHSMMCVCVFTFCVSRKQQEKEKCKSSTTWRGYVSEKAAVRRFM